MTKPRWRRLFCRRVATAVWLAGWIWVSGCATFDTYPPPEGTRPKPASDVSQRSAALSVRGGAYETSILGNSEGPLSESLKIAAQKAVRESGNFSIVEPEGANADLRINVLVSRSQNGREGGLFWLAHQFLRPDIIDIRIVVTTTVSAASNARGSSSTQSHTYRVWYQPFLLPWYSGHSPSKHGQDVVYGLTQASVNKALAGLGETRAAGTTGHINPRPP